MRRNLRIVASLLCWLGAATVAQADPIEPYLGTKGYANINTDSLVSFDLHIPVGDDISGVVPELVAQFGFGPAAVGLNLGLSYANPDTSLVDSGTWFGNIALFGKGRHCLELGGTKACFGGQLEVSIAPMEADDAEDAIAIAFGTLNHLRLGGRFSSELLVFTPTLGFQLVHDLFFAQFHIGPEVIVYLNDDVAEFMGDDADAALIYGFAAGVNILSLVSAGVGFRGNSTLSFDNNDSAYAFDIIAQFHLPFVKPYLMLSIPVDEDSRDLLDMSISLGAAAIF